VSCLPVAGKENPYQYLMMKGLNESPNLEVKSGIDDKFFGIIRTAVFQKPDYIHFDWETSYPKLTITAPFVIERVKQLQMA
jgi:hypothetical protein